MRHLPSLHPFIANRRNANRMPVTNIQDLARMTDEMLDTYQTLIADCEDADVVFVPDDPEAHDLAAANESDIDLAWTLGHVIVHMTASGEEAAFLAAELARGVEHHGRSRFEVPWQMMLTIEGCRKRIEESRRMRLATLQVWPDEPHLENVYIPQRKGVRPKSAIGYFLHGLRHDASHLEHVRKIIQQARTARMLE